MKCTVYSGTYLPFDDHDNPVSWLLLLSSFSDEELEAQKD